MDALSKLKENLSKEVKELEKEEVKEEEVITKNIDTPVGKIKADELFTLPKKKKNVTDGAKQFTTYLTKEQINYIKESSKNAGMTKSEFMQHIIKMAQNMLKIE